MFCIRNKKVFCRGFLCRKSDRDNKCRRCGVYVCNLCSAKFKGNVYCIDCYIEHYVEQDFKEMINKGLDKLKIK